MSLGYLDLFFSMVISFILFECILGFILLFALKKSTEPHYIWIEQLLYYTHKLLSVWQTHITDTQIIYGILTVIVHYLYITNEKETVFAEVKGAGLEGLSPWLFSEESGEHWNNHPLVSKKEESKFSATINKSIKFSSPLNYGKIKIIKKFRKLPICT